MDQNNKITLDDMVNEKSPETIAKEKEVLAQREAKNRAASNAEKFMQKKRAEAIQAEKERKAKKEADEQRAKDEHMEKVLDGMEAPQSSDELFGQLGYDMQNLMARKQREMDMINEYKADKAQEAEDAAEIERMAQGSYEDTFEYDDEEPDTAEDNIDRFIVQDDDMFNEPDEETEDEEVEEEKDLSQALDEISDEDFEGLDDDFEDFDIDDDFEEDDEDQDATPEEEKKEVVETKDGRLVEKFNYTDDEIRDIYTKQAKEKIKVVNNNKIIDLTKFKKTGNTTVNSAVKKVQIADAAPNVIRNPLYNSNLCQTVEGFKGQELARILELMNSDVEVGMNLYNRYRTLFNILYKHDISEGKPKNLDAWLKEITEKDLDHLYFGVYRSCYNAVNYMPFRCEKCGHVYISDNIPLKDLFKFKTDDDKKKADKVANLEVRKPRHEIIEKQVSDDYVIDFKAPSLYNSYIEYNLLDNEFIRKHGDLIVYLTYIDNIFYINRQTMALEKVELDIYDKDRRKQFIGKVQRFSKILKQFNSDQLTYIQSCMNEIANKSVVDVEYVLPEQVCPHCGETIPEEPATAQSLLFTRHQLALLANS